MTTISEKRSGNALVLLALATGGFAIGTTEFATMSLLPFIARGLDVDEPTAGHIVSAYAMGVVVGAPVLAVLSARMRRRGLLVALMLLFAFGNGLSAVAPTYRWMLAFRFLSGLPHGAYFGIAALVAAGIMGPERRTAAVGRVMLGLTVATIVGVPLANELGQWAGWRWGFAIVAVLALLTATLVRLFAPDDPAAEGASPLRELGALRPPAGLADARHRRDRLWRPVRRLRLPAIDADAGDRDGADGDRHRLRDLRRRHDDRQHRRAALCGPGACADGDGDADDERGRHWACFPLPPTACPPCCWTCWRSALPHRSPPCCRPG